MIIIIVLGSCLREKMCYVGSDCINCNWCTWNISKTPGKKTAEIGNQ